MDFTMYSVHVCFLLFTFKCMCQEHINQCTLKTEWECLYYHNPTTLERGNIGVTLSVAQTLVCPHAILHICGLNYF